MQTDTSRPNPPNTFNQGKESAKLKNKEKEPQNDEQKDVAEVSHSQQLPRLRRIEGQVRGLHKMIETERDCLDITHQISAIINALRRVQSDMLHDHLAALGEAIIAEEITPKKRRELADEIRDHLKRLS